MMCLFHQFRTNPERNPGRSKLRGGLAALFICTAWVWVSALGGCAGQSSKAAGSGNKSADELAMAVTNSGPGYISVAESPYGRGWAAAGEPYMSALGLPCRRVVFVNENQDRYDLAVCAEKGGVWSTAPSIFASNKN